MAVCFFSLEMPIAQFAPPSTGTPSICAFGLIRTMHVENPRNTDIGLPAGRGCPVEPGNSFAVLKADAGIAFVRDRRFYLDFRQSHPIVRRPIKSLDAVDKPWRGPESFFVEINSICFQKVSHLPDLHPGHVIPLDRVP